MQGAPKQPVNAEDMLAELKQALEASEGAPAAPRLLASTPPKSSGPVRGDRQSQIHRTSGPVRTSAARPLRQTTALQKSTQTRSRRWKLAAASLVLAGAIAVWASVAFMNRTEDFQTQDTPVATRDGLGKSQDRDSVEPPTSGQTPIENGGTVLRNVNSGPASGVSEVVAPNLASSGLETTPAFTPSTPAVVVPSHAIRMDGSPVAGPPSLSLPTDLAPHAADASKPATPMAGPQIVKLDDAPAPPARASIDPAPSPTETTKPAAPTAPQQIVKPDNAPSPPVRASIDAAPSQTETTKPAASTAPQQIVKPDNAPAPPARTSIKAAPSPAETPKPATSTAGPQLATPEDAPTPPARASIDAALSPTETPKLKPTRAASASNELPESSPKPVSKRKPTEKPAEQKSTKSVKAEAKAVPQTERQPTEPPPPKEAEKSPPPAQDASRPIAAPPVAKASVQQRVADGVTHAFGYLVHLPGALVPHLGGPNPPTQ